MRDLQLWGYDSAAGVWRKVAVDASGLLLVDMSNINLDDLADVDTTGVADDDIIYYDSASGTWKPMAIPPPLAHKTSHQDGGADEISVAGLDGEPSTLTTHKAATTGIHGADADHLALFPAASTVVNRVVWKDASETALTDSNRTVSLGFTDVDLTAYTSATAKFAILRLAVHIDSYTSGILQLALRKNGTTPSHPIHVRPVNHPEAEAFVYEHVIIGLDTDQVIEYKVDITGVGQIDSYIHVLGYIE